MEDSAELIIELLAEPRGAVGYGMVFVCEVRRVSKGILEDKVLRMTILPTDQAYADFLTAHSSPSTVEAGFKKEREDEPYGLMPITGFVDDRKTSWRLVYLE